MTKPTPTVRLRTGIEEAKPLVATVGYQLRELLRDKPIALLELATFCRDPLHTFFGDTQADVQHLLEPAPDGVPRIRDSIRNIILASIEGEGPDMALVSPLN